MMTVEEALRNMLKEISLIRDIETVSLMGAMGRIAAEDCVVRSQPPGVHAVRRCDGADGLASLDHMDRHETSPLGTSLCGGECGYASRETA